MVTYYSLYLIKILVKEIDPQQVILATSTKEELESYLWSPIIKKKNLELVAMRKLSYIPQINSYH